MARTALLVTLLLSLSAGSAAAVQQPPIRSPQDQACRDEATMTVFDAPDPENLGPYKVGRRIYLACMQRISVPEPVKPAPRRRPAA